MGAIRDLFNYMEQEMLKEYRASRDAAWRKAEHDTNGVLVSKEGQRRGIHGYDLFSGAESYALRWASEELLEHWNHHPRPNRKHFEEQWLQGRMPYL